MWRRVLPGAPHPRSPPGSVGGLPILYTAGWGRSGSTLLSALLGGLPGVVAAGEARSFWQKGLVERAPCACGLAVTECPVWGPVAAAAAGGEWPMAPEELARFQADHLRTRDYVTAWPRLRFRGPTVDEIRYARTYAALLHTLGETTGAGVIVDNSKYPLDAHLLARVAGVDVRVLHLVRDPRAVAHSWATPKALTPEPGAPQLKRFRPAYSSAIWTTWNEMVHRLLRDRPTLTVRYEDLVADPAGTLTAVARFAGVAVDAPIDPSTLRQAPNHMVAGNPIRFATGDVVIREDERWKAAMPAGRRLEAILPALPIMRRYGYRLRRAPAPGRRSAPA